MNKRTRAVRLQNDQGAGGRIIVHVKNTGIRRPGLFYGISNHRTLAVFAHKTPKVNFFVQGRKFRQPAYLATSFSEQVARGFIADRGGDDCTLWRVHIDPERKCVHVNLVKKTNVPGEEEYLFAPYSTFTVLSAVWRAGTAEGPHEIELLAAVDNKEEPEGLPLAPWS